MKIYHALFVIPMTSFGIVVWLRLLAFVTGVGWNETLASFVFLMSFVLGCLFGAIIISEFAGRGYTYFNIFKKGNKNEKK